MTDQKDPYAATRRAIEAAIAAGQGDLARRLLAQAERTPPPPLRTVQS